MKHHTNLRGINWLAWILVFFSGVGFFAWLEWKSSRSFSMALFLAASLWSAVCGIGYTLIDWLLRRSG